jgi:signal transduction histidine kinase
LTIADQVAVAIENARLYEQERRRAEELAALNAVAARLGQSLELQDVLEVAMEEVTRTLDVEGAAISLVDEGLGELILRAQYGLHHSHLGVRVPLEASLSGQVVRTDEVIVTGNGGLGARRVAPEFDQEEIQAMILVPVHSRGVVVGVLSAVSHTPHKFAEQEVSLLKAIANQVGAAVENAQLFETVKQHAANLEQAYAQLEEADRLKDELAQNVSHELRAPITFIKGYVSLLLNGDLGPLTPLQRQGLEVMARKTDQLAHLVEDIITLEVVSSETLQRQPLDLNTLLRTAVAAGAPAAANAGVQLRAELAKGLAEIPADSARLMEVLDNLLGNAIKFSPNGGTVTVRAQDAGDWIRVEIADTGIGIPEDKLSRIFDRFYQVDGTSRRRFGGAGLGLAIVKRIIEAHGGKVWASSELECGSTFFLTLPKT